MFDHLEVNNRLAQMGYENCSLEHLLIEKCGRANFMAWQLVTVERISLRAAAEALGCSHTTIRRRVSIVQPEADFLEREIEDAA